eukprot:Em0013g468a
MWDATCRDTLAPSHLSTAERGPGLVAAEAESQKRKKYSSLGAKYFFVPIACLDHVVQHCRLLSEIEDVLGDRKKVTGDDLDKLKYTEQVIQEVLRMYPTVIRMIKESPRGGLELSGYHIPEGASISFFTAVMSRNPAFFNDPDTFDPSRFDVDRPRPGPFVYFPFSVGHRSCIGRHFAMIGLKITLTRLLKTFRVTLPPSFSLVVEQRITLQPQGGVPCTLREIS